MAMENYLLSIFQLGEQGLRVSLTSISEKLKRLPEGHQLGTSLPSVGGMVRRMVREGLVEITVHKDVLLTSKGRKSAHNMVRRHRLAERMVVDLLGVELERAHVEAHRLEHAISPELEAKIVERLGNPKTCPFGHPIPGSGYVLPQNSCRLDEAPTGQVVVVDRIPEDDQPLLRYLVNNGIMPTSEIQVVEAAPYRGVITLRSNGNHVVLAYEVASRIRVCPSG